MSALSNAERQRRYIARLKERARRQPRQVHSRESRQTLRNNRPPPPHHKSRLSRHPVAEEVIRDRRPRRNNHDSVKRIVATKRAFAPSVLLQAPPYRSSRSPLSSIAGFSAPGRCRPPAANAPQRPQDARAGPRGCFLTAGRCWPLAGRHPSYDPRDQRPTHGKTISRNHLLFPYPGAWPSSPCLVRTNNH